MVYNKIYMNYFLLANNKNFSQQTIDKLKIHSEHDTLVLFNFLIPLKFDKIRNYPNKICISRKRPIKDRLDSKYIPGIKEYYINFGTIRASQDLFKEIYVLPCPHNMGKLAQDFRDHISLFKFNPTKIKCIDYDINSLNKRLVYFRSGIQAEVSTGIIVYDYFRNIKGSEDKIILVAFNSAVSKFHDKDWETNYFLNQIDQKKCLTIDSYGLPDSWI